MVEEFESTSNGHLGSICKPKHHIYLLNDRVRTVHIALYRAAPTARMFTTTEIGLIIAEELFKPASTEWKAPILYLSSQDCSLCFGFHYHNLNTVIICDLYPLPCFKEWLDGSEERTVFQRLDSKSRTLQIGKEKRNQDKPAFKSIIVC